MLFDLSYLHKMDFIEKTINDSAELLELDETFKESYLDLIKRYYALFENIFQYYQQITSFMNDINDGKYIEFTMEVIIADKDGKKLLVETMHHYASMLLLLDRLIPAVARERLYMCYLRYLGSSASPLNTRVCKLIADTGYFYNKSTGEEKIPEKYPANYFNKFKLDSKTVEQFINAMKDDDIYEMTSVYGNNPNHRSQALSTQASIIFTLLPFVPRILDDHEPKMREICDKHFPDNWVIPIYSGYLVDLLKYWESFPAAKKALSNNIMPDQVSYLCEK